MRVLKRILTAASVTLALAAPVLVVASPAALLRRA
jgi:hypothetical protein